MVKTRQDLVALVDSIPGAENAVGVDLTKWANGQIRGVEDRWLDQYNAAGDDTAKIQHLKNVIACFLNIRSVGFDDFSDEKQKMADAYRGYLAHAKDEAAAQQGVVDSITAQLKTATGDRATILSTQQAVESTRLSNALGNVSTWQNTLDQYLKAHPEVH